MCWFVLIFSIFALIAGVYSINWYVKLDADLEHGKAYDVELGNYVLSAIGAYLLPTGGIVGILISLYLIVCQLGGCL